MRTDERRVHDSDDEASDRPKKKTRHPALSFLGELPGLIVMAFALALLIKSLLIQAFWIPTGSMEPTLVPGDRVIVAKVPYYFHDPMRGDIVVFRLPKDDSTDYIKRVIGEPGDVGAGDASLACVQAKLVVSNARRSFVTRQFAIEYGMRFELLFPGLVRLGLPVPLGGTSNHFRTSVLRGLGGWDAWNVTEDADLGMRSAALGYRVDSITRGEMPHEVGPWTRQRTRWQKRWMLTALVHTRNPVETWRAFGGAGTTALLLVLAGTPLLHLAQSLAFVLWVSGYTALGAEDLRGLAGRFHAEHRRRYGYRMDDEPVELVNLRLVATVPGDKPRLREGPPRGEVACGRRRASFDGDWHEVDVVARADLGAGSAVGGPAVVELAESTLLVRPGWRGVVDGAGALVLERAP